MAKSKDTPAIQIKQRKNKDLISTHGQRTLKIISKCMKKLKSERKNVSEDNIQYAHFCHVVLQNLIWAIEYGPDPFASFVNCVCTYSVYGMAQQGSSR